MSASLTALCPPLPPPRSPASIWVCQGHILLRPMFPLKNSISSFFTFKVDTGSMLPNLPGLWQVCRLRLGSEMEAQEAQRPQGTTHRFNVSSVAKVLL